MAIAIAQPPRRLPALGFIPRRTLIATVVLLLFLGLWEGYGMVTAPARIGPNLQTELARGDRPLYDVTVELPFAPRQFHIKMFQTYGTMAGTDGNIVKLRRVSPERIQEIARKYWVRQVELAAL